ncbi:uncharacterized protein LOC130730839 [Lotus japonicus]|uniref:uncharacterized protein LOC130730839 n=1 Tax=Lotus japonicus TaxID=34305 RepID=UPI002584C70A|nr:uncharacterized protein LOC130730839 [Lotus japonicus]
MSNKIVLMPAGSSTRRRQPLLKSQSSSKRVGEVVGSTTAECVAVCCCCPCGIANILLLAIYKVPAGLCRNMLKKRRRRRVIKEGTPLAPPRRRQCSCGTCDDMSGPLRIHPMCANDASDIKRLHAPEPDNDDALALEKEMWERFYNTGFWRSSSRRESESSPEKHEPQYQVAASSFATSTEHKSP